LKKRKARGRLINPISEIRMYQIMTEIIA